MMIGKRSGERNGWGHEHVQHVTLESLPDAPAEAEGVIAERTGTASRSGAAAEPAHRRGPWRIVTTVMSTVAGIVLGAVALLAVLVAINSHFSTDGQLGFLGYPVMSVLSGSMDPVIKTGDLVVDNKLTLAQAANLHPGQIISFRASAGSTQIFTHRIVGVEQVPGGGVGYVTKGDANDSRDAPVTPSTNVVGLYHSTIPAGGYVINALHRPLVLGLILASPILWLLSEPLWKWAREPKLPTGDTTAEGGESPT